MPRAPAEFIDFNAVNGFCAAAILVQVLKQCGDDLSRENIMRQAANLKDLELPMLLPMLRGVSASVRFVRVAVGGDADRVQRAP
jgi:branched-chain amino acid transport system substrate-binding protein